MVHYKLTYFNSRGLAEVSRQLFKLANVEFEDVRIEREDGTWETLKPNFPFGHLPVLNVDGFEIPESCAIARYLARKFGYAGKTPEEEAWVDAIVDLFKDYVTTFRQLTGTARLEKPAKEIAKERKIIRKDIFEPAKESYFKNLNKILEKSESGFLVGDGVTFADLFVVDNLTTLKNMGFYNPADEPKLAQLQNKVTSIPEIKAWIEKRPINVK